MDETIEIEKRVIKKEDSNALIDKEITFYVDQQTESNSTTVEEFFQLYDKLYFEIPIEGDTNSHEYLVKTSSELYKLEEDISNLQPLLDEIAQLRTRLLEANNTILDLENKINS
jgi:hypothetical protein